MKIVHIINSLKKGGAEGNLYRLCKFQKKKYKNKIEITIITLIEKGFYETDLRKNGINILSLKINKRGNLFNLLNKAFKLRKYIIAKNPDVIQSWMYHSNFVSLFVPKLFYNKLFWNIRHSELNSKISKKKTILISILCGIFSNFVPKKIIYCSEKSIKFHENKHFYSKNKTTLIYNGYSEKIFYPSKQKRLNFRKINKIGKHNITIGFAGRYAKQKNLFSILNAFTKIAKIYKNTSLYLVGKDLNPENKKLLNHVDFLNIREKVNFLNEQKNLLEFYNGIDFLILASHSESFPNVIAESMLSSTPVLASDAGCSEKIIKQFGFVMKKNDDQSIFKNLNRVIKVFKSKKAQWKLLKKNSRLRIIQNFSIKKMSDSYLKSWMF